MKLIGSGLFIIIGIIIAIIVTRSFGEKSAGYVINIIVGVVSAFAGLWIKDLFDIQVLGNLTGAALFSIIAAIVTLVPLNYFYRAMSR